MKTYIEIFNEANNFTNDFLEEILPKLPILEYNSDTSAEHLNRDEDIVRATDIDETVES